MSTTAKNRVGPPRFDRRERLRHRFYEPLYMLWALNPSTGSIVSQPSFGPGLTNNLRPLGKWRAFLDALAWFGDHKHGGASVPAVAVQAKESGAVFWVCGRYKSSYYHIAGILRELAIIASRAADDEQPLQAIEERIISGSLFFSRDRVKTYCEDLSDHIRSALLSADSLGEAVAAKLRETLLVPSRTDLIAVCNDAHHNDIRQQLDQLVQESSTFGRTSSWVNVRHCVTRLGSWHRKVRILTAFAKEYPQLLEGSSCSFLQLPLPTRLPTADAKTNIHSALKRMLPADEQARADDLYAQIRDFRAFDLESRFIELYTANNVQLRVHAEAFLLEHFYFNGIPYALGDKYIGCSKPSCYCCHLYQRYHPDNPVIRPCHGTAWARWSPPLMSNEETDGERAKHNLNVMNGVIAHIRRDVLEEIEKRMPRRERVPDSTSGVTIRSID